MDSHQDPDNPSLIQPPSAATKRELRRWAKDARVWARAENGSALDESVRAFIKKSPLFTEARTVAVYLPMPGEVNIEPLLAAQKRFAAPRMHDLPEPHLTFHEVGSSGIELHDWGVRQPPAHAPSVALYEMDLLLVPGLLFDEHGARIGYGKGFYDRLLAVTGPKPPTVGVALEALVLPKLPTSRHDMAVDYLVTELGIRPTRR